MDTIFFIAVLIFSVMLHELAHGYMANFLGDPTARLARRLSFNPLRHIDPMGSVFLPLLLKLSGSPILIGYAKPVPYNPYNLRGRYGEALVAFAGPATNIVLAVFFGLLVRVLVGANIGSPQLIDALALITLLNMMLALFNLIPIPPLDGSKILSHILPEALGRVYDNYRMRMERLGVLSSTLLILLLFYMLAPLFAIALGALFRLLTGL